MFKRFASKLPSEQSSFVYDTELLIIFAVTAGVFLAILAASAIGLIPPG